MATNNHNTLKSFLQTAVHGTVLLANQLEKLNVSRNLQQYYKRSGWLKSVGSGAFILPQSKLEWQGALHTIQNQTDVAVHAGGLTALSLLGFAHYIRFSNIIYLFLGKGSKLPKWFMDYKWEQPIKDYRASFLPEALALTKYKTQNFFIAISSAERAILECLYLVPEVDMVECYHLMEGLASLRPNVLQDLLEKCTSIKVKRLFLYMADKLSHAWFKYIDQSKIDLGKGDRSLVKSGVYIKKYGIVVPQTLAAL